MRDELIRVRKDAAIARSHLRSTESRNSVAPTSTFPNEVQHNSDNLNKSIAIDMNSNAGLVFELKQQIEKQNEWIEELKKQNFQLKESLRETAEKVV